MNIGRIVGEVCLNAFAWFTFGSRIRQIQRDVAWLRRQVASSPGLRAFPLDDRMALIRLAGGQRMVIDPHDQGVGGRLLFYGTWERFHVRFAQRLIGPGTLCIDVGANAGFFSVVFAELSGPEGKVIAFEPNPDVFALLEVTLRLNRYHVNGRAVAHAVALSDTAGTVTLAFHAENTGGGTIMADPLRAGKGDGRTTRQIEARTLDSYDLDPTRPIFLKIDAEGAEPKVVAGARALIAAAPDITIMMEFTPLLLRKSMPVDRFLAELSDLCLHFHIVEGPKLRPASKEEIVAVRSCYLFLSKRPIPAMKPGPSRFE